MRRPPLLNVPFRKGTQLGSQAAVPLQATKKEVMATPSCRPLFPLWRRSVLDQAMREGFGIVCKSVGRGDQQRSNSATRRDGLDRQVPWYARTPHERTPLAAETLQAPSARMHESLPVREMFFFSRTCR